VNPEERTRLAAGESEELPPPPPSSPETSGIDPEDVLVAPGDGGPDDPGDVEVDRSDLRLPGGMGEGV
jgi:hypothetical protein